MKSNTGVLWHITSQSNLESILNIGIDPAFSAGKRDLSWYVKKNRIEDMILHISVRHNLSVPEMVVLGVVIDWDAMIRTAWKGVYCTKQNYPVETVSLGVMFVYHDWKD